jgi:hypothetical protein
MTTGPQRHQNSDEVLAGLGLTPEVTKATRSYLSQYIGFKGPRPFTLEGLGLTTPQKTEIKRRIAAWVARNTIPMVGWPCAPFKSKALVVKYMKAQLIGNGFRPFMTFTFPSPRQIRFAAIQDGQAYTGVIAKNGPRQIRVGLFCNPLNLQQRDVHVQPQLRRLKPEP